MITTKEANETHAHVVRKYTGPQSIKPCSIYSSAYKMAKQLTSPHC